MHSTQQEFFQQGSYTTIDREVVGNGGNGGFGSGGEASPSFVAFLFDGFSGELVDLLFSDVENPIESPSLYLCLPWDSKYD